MSLAYKISRELSRATPGKLALHVLNTFFSFASFSILGWGMEVSYRSLRDRRFINPGLLKGPYLMLYGSGSLLLMTFIPILKKRSLADKIFVYSIVTTGFELISGRMAKSFFNTRLWDYSDQPFNYKGLICAKFSGYWILLAFAFEYLMFPPYHGIRNRLSPVFKGVFTGMTVLLMLVDFMVVFIRQCFGMTSEEKSMMETEFMTAAKPLLEHPMVSRLSSCEHHRGKTRLEHVTQVAYISFVLGKYFSLDNKAIVRGALLHDLFYYDWLREGPRLHGFRHHNIALKNAQKITHLSKKETDIIKRHMWPLTVIPPRYMESLIVCLVDTFCSTMDYVGVKGQKDILKGTG
ncbi:MAG: phosphohydrolase [Thermodesulfobacteriota bacterium]|nr:phosphohydrolase [Thermodesulfobacteriota bacterium]